MASPHHPLILLALAAPVAAQGAFTSAPTGLEFREGGSDSRDVLGTEPQLRYQQIDSTPSVLPLVRQVAFRRDGRVLSSPAYAGRTVDLELLLGESDLTAISTTFDANYAAPPTIAFTRKQVQFPDWTTPNTLPGQLDLVLPLDQAWTYLGASGPDVLWEVRIYGNSAAGQEYPFDLEYVVPGGTFQQNQPVRSGHIDLGIGCQVALGEAHMDVDVWNYKTKFTLDAHLHITPNAPVSLLIGTFNANVITPVLCSTLHVVDGFALPVGVTGPTGDFDIDLDPLPYNSSWIGLDLVTQCIAPDATQTGGPVLPIALSSGAQLKIPPDPQPPAVGRIWALDPNAVAATVGPIPGGIVAHFAP